MSLIEKVSFEGRPSLKADEDQNCGSYLVCDQRDKSKTKYVMKIIDLEDFTSLNDFIVRSNIDMGFCTRTCLLFRETSYGINN